MSPSDREWLEAWCKARLERMRASRDLADGQQRFSLEQIDKHENMESKRAALIARSTEAKLEAIGEQAPFIAGPFRRGAK